jgi:hypothetical protein
MIRFISSIKVLNMKIFNTALTSSTLAILVVAGLLCFTPSRLLAENTDRSTAEAVCQRADIIFCENWEDGDSAGWSDFRTTASSSTVLWGGHSCLVGNCDFPYMGFHSNQAVALRLPPNDPDSMYPSSAYNSPVGTNETIYARFYVYWSEGFQYNTTNTKNFYLNANGAWRVGFFVRPARTPSGSVEDTSYTTAVPYFHLYCAHIDTNSTTQAACDYSGGDLRLTPNLNSNFRIKGGTWYAVEMMVTPNPVGQSFGGQLRMWINGNLIADYSDVSVRHASTSEPLARVNLSTYFGGGGQSTHPDQYVLYDNIVVGKSYIGPMAIEDQPDPVSPSKPPQPAVP